ncbi:phosphoribosylformylglycinamidine synthase [Candidatus Woesearchaeota archaeon]|jgi:phosphoribosylformylglycinamidine synthase|nr:phosphoribosylformylglycinamidine synthase [Candidatus Woesearchaeota archaeon]|tara:strand:- start:29624 stop:31966 length:2343 start_codon:yes stop_codon:yes gene_type:complete
MGGVEVDLVDIKAMSDRELSGFLRKNAVSLSVFEAKRVVELIGRNPTLTELYIFNTQWSEHSSYKSSRSILKELLPTKAPNVILGPVEDSGIVELGYIDGERYGIVVSHESHNHPSQVVPYEGAATGVGGILRDVLCMGAKIIATADPLRFGNPNGKDKNRVKYVANEVINGIAGYGDAVGIPNIGGDVYFNDSFDENCLVNVVCLGIVKEKDIIHSFAPESAEGYDIIIVGKATDNSGFGGAAFASLILDEKDRESNRGAVQVPDPFLKNVLIRATYAVFEEARKQGIKLGFKDMGAGGIMCSTSEVCSSSDFGAEIDLSKVNVSMKDLPPYIIANSETQERFTWICPSDFTKTLLKIYNKDFELPNISLGAGAFVIGKVTAEQDYVLRHNNQIVCNVPINAITEGIRHERIKEAPRRDFKEPILKEPKDCNKALLSVLRHPNVASKAKAYKHYDTSVMGNAVISSGYADAGVLKVDNSSYGVALKTDCNPRYCRIDPYWGAVNAVAESMRNVAAVGATPSALTDCLNYGNPENQEAFYDFYEGVRGIADAAKHLRYKGTKFPMPFISGNVSFYNESSSGKAVDPSPVIACVGVLKDYSKAITMKIKKEGSTLFLIGKRKDELGGSVYYDVNDEIGAIVPIIDFESERNMTSAVVDAIDSNLLLSCHDVSDGGLATTISEMILGGDADGRIGAEINLDFTDLRTDKALFSESSGFVFEVDNQNLSRLKTLFKFYKIDLVELGKTDGTKLIFNKNNKKIIDLHVDKLKEAWTMGFVEALE